MIQPKIPIKHEPMYGWAIRKDGTPVPIAAAVRGERYFCPICKGEVIPKMGEVNQHHFAHLSLIACTPETVARAVAGIWLVNALKQKLAVGEAVNVVWQTGDHAEQHSVNVLKDVSLVAQNYQSPVGKADIALLNAAGKLKTVILLGIEGTPDSAKVTEWTRAGVAVILLNPIGVRSGQIELGNLLANSQVLGGWWLLEKTEMPEGLVMEAEALRDSLKAAVSKPPYAFCAELHSEGGMSHIVELDGKKLWLPPEVWKEVVGGSRNRLQAGIEVMLQDWAQSDDSHIALFYIRVKDKTAIALRRFAAGQPVVIELQNTQFRLSKITAIDLARQLAGIPVELPR